MAREYDYSKQHNGGRHDAPLCDFALQSPPEYDYRIEFERVGGNNSVSQVCSAAGATFDWCMGGTHDTVCYLGAVAGKVGEDSPPVSC